jgi:hypothetical protein
MVEEDTGLRDMIFPARVNEGGLTESVGGGSKRGGKEEEGSEHFRALVWLMRSSNS